ncbi:MAG TPA: hypothetical protein PLO50_02515 [Nitrospira sp.]|nr:hypothetical protein [Nitrospira sp.]
MSWPTRPASLWTKRITRQNRSILRTGGEFVAQISAWFQKGKITFCEDIVDGIEKASQALISLLEA